MDNNDIKKIWYKIAFDFTTFLVLLASMFFWFDIEEHKVVYGSLLIVAGLMGCISLLLEKHIPIFKVERKGYAKILNTLYPFTCMLLIVFGLTHVLR